MSMKKWIVPLIVLFFWQAQPILAQQSGVGTLAILRFHAIGVDAVTAQSAEAIFRQEVGRLSVWNLVSEKRTVSTIDEPVEFDGQYALAAGKKLGAGRVVLCQLASLGDKVIVQYLMADVAEGRVILQDRLTASSVEDLDTVMKRVAVSLAEQAPVQQTAQVGLITQQESRQPLKRGANKFGGFSFGYLFPLSGYDDAGRSFAMDFRAGAEFESYAAGMQLFIRKGFGINLFSSYLLSKKDVCPYIGGGLGFHWVSHEGHYSDPETSHEEKQGDGFEVTVNGGLRLFHTYNFQLLINGAFSFCLNDYHDQAFVLTFGLLR